MEMATPTVLRPWATLCHVLKDCGYIQSVAGHGKQHVIPFITSEQRRPSTSVQVGDMLASFPNKNKKKV
jgi:hypothetical protein